MSFRLLIPIFVAMILGLGACGKSEEPAEQQAAPATGAAEEKAATEATAEPAKEGDPTAK
jgi:hypothetical protein